MGSARTRNRRRSRLQREAQAAPTGPRRAHLSLRPVRCGERSERWREPGETRGQGPGASENREEIDEIDEIAARCGLTPTERAVLTMARLQQYPQAEIAAELGLTPRQVSET